MSRWNDKYADHKTTLHPATELQAYGQFCSEDTIKPKLSLPRGKPQPPWHTLQHLNKVAACLSQVCWVINVRVTNQVSCSSGTVHSGQEQHVHSMARISRSLSRPPLVLRFTVTSVTSTATGCNSLCSRSYCVIDCTQRLYLIDWSCCDVMTVAFGTQRPEEITNSNRS